MLLLLGLWWHHNMGTRSALLSFCERIHLSSMYSPHKGRLMQKIRINTINTCIYIASTFEFFKLLQMPIKQRAPKLKLITKAVSWSYCLWFFRLIHGVVTFFQSLYLNHCATLHQRGNYQTLYDIFPEELRSWLRTDNRVCSIISLNYQRRLNDNSLRPSDAYMRQ